MELKMKKQHKFSIWYVILGIWGVLILHNMIASALVVKTIRERRFCPKPLPVKATYRFSA
jgi:hypothetical protein